MSVKTVAWRRSKIIAARLLVNGFTGRALAILFRDRIPAKGCRFDTRSPAIAQETKSSIYWGLFESAEYRFVRQYLDPTLDTIELGSGIGVISSFLGQKLEAGRRLVCVEANPRLIATLRKNLCNNVKHVDYHVVHAAVDPASLAADRPVTFAVTKDHIGSHIGTRSDAEAETVRATSLTNLLQTQELGEYQLVADIEGGEAGFIYDEPAALDRCRLAIVELHDTTFQGRLLTADAMADHIRDNLGFRQLATYGDVHVFAR